MTGVVAVDWFGIAAVIAAVGSATATVISAMTHRKLSGPKDDDANTGSTDHSPPPG